VTVHLLDFAVSGTLFSIRDLEGYLEAQLRESFPSLQRVQLLSSIRRRRRLQQQQVLEGHAIFVAPGPLKTEVHTLQQGALADTSALRAHVCGNA